jgi:hypothetical protein
MNKNIDFLYYGIKILSLVILILILLFFFDLISINWISLNVLLLQFFLVIVYRKFKPFAILILFVIPYTLVAYLHFNNHEFPLHLGSRIEFDNEKYYSNVFVILALFWAVFTLVLPKLKAPLVLRNYIQFKNQPLFFYAILFFQVFILLYGRTGGNIFQTGGYGSADSNTTNLGGGAIFEYFLIFYPVAYIYSNKNKFKLNLLIFLALIYCIKSILFGGRIEALQCLLLIFVLHLDDHKTSLFKIILFSIIPVLFFVLFGFVRSSPDLNFIEIVEIIVNNINFAGYTFFGNQIDVYYSSTRLYGFIDLNIISLYERFQIFLYNIAAIFTPYSLLPIKANLALFKQDEYTAGGGGLFPIFFYVYLSYYGVIFIATLLGYFFSRIIRFKFSTSNYFLIYMIMVVSTYPRWYAYSSNVMYKFCLYSIIILFIINSLSKYLKNNN